MTVLCAYEQEAVQFIMNDVPLPGKYRDYIDVIDFLRHNHSSTQFTWSTPLL